ncbi:delta-lactam-biosynthetic de-N-acetylase [Clostridium guangxiense]|uniref:delta-lactam-biosynthetic de-N-acetylase n=1 Tax=Clostridium guangxiense TaxID=1662055 RepID=UPI0038B2B420
MLKGKILCGFMAFVLTINCFFYSAAAQSSSKTLDKQSEKQEEIKEYIKEPVLDQLKNVFFSKYYNGLSSRAYEWYYMNPGKNVTPGPPKESSKFVPKYDCYYMGDQSKKIIYLTFDEGYEKGYTGKILDALKKHNVKAAFFVVKPYIAQNPDLVKRMVNEGHLVCNHSARHPSMPSIIDENKFKKELTDVEDAYTKVTGKKMPKYFRPPMGRYSELSLYTTKKLGYKTIFWSFAYEDWEQNKQPSHEFAIKRIMDKTHNGSVLLLHAVSKTNSDIMDELLTRFEKEGYKIETVDELVKQ